MKVYLDPKNIADYKLFRDIKKLPAWRIRGRCAEFPDEYAATLGMAAVKPVDVDWTPAEFLFDYQRDLVKMAIAKRKFAIFADCLGGESVINSPDGDITIEDAFNAGNPLRVYALHGSRVVIADASAPFINGVNRLYRFVMNSGKTITATMGHRFLTSSGWRRGESLRIGERLAVSDASHLRSILGTGLSALRGDVPRSFQKAQGCLDDYCHGFRQYDAQPLSVSDSDQVSFPLQVDARGHSLTRLRMDVRESISGYSRHHRPACRLSIDRFSLQAATTEEVEECQPHACGRTCTDENNHTSRLIHEGTIPERQALEFHPSEEQQSEGDRDRAFLTCDSSLCEWDTLVAIQYIRTDVFYDIEVPGPANFLADGVWSHNCGLGKTLVFLEYMQAARQQMAGAKGVLMVCPLMVVGQTMDEARRFYPAMEVEQVRAANLQTWLDNCAGKIGITNYDAMNDHLRAGELGGLVLDESSMLKSHYGKWGTALIDLGRGLEWKLCGTGTPAPNDRIEYANHAVFLDHFPTVNSFLATYFINRGQTQERWSLKDHALGPFYRALSHWCIFLTNPATYGWKDNCDTIPPIHVHIHNVDLTSEQTDAFRGLTGKLFATDAGGIASRGKLGQIAKGHLNGKQIATGKPTFIRNLVGSWPDESTIIWCIYNQEQDSIEREFPGAASIRGNTPLDERIRLIDDFKAGRRKVLISKPKVLGFGLNLQVATRQVFSGLQDSYESYYQAVKRSNRIGSTRPLNVHIPVTDLEEPMVQNVLRKSAMVQRDTEEQERIFKSWATN